MKLALTNLGRLAVPVIAEDGVAVTIGPSETLSLENASTVWLLGDKPDFIESLREGIELVLQVLAFWRERVAANDSDAGVLSFKLSNEGDKAVRVIPGTVDTEFELAPSETRDTTAIDYIELRELTGWNPVEGTP